MLRKNGIWYAGPTSFITLNPWEVSEEFGGAIDDV
jgi:hypothetical protein